MHNYHSSHPDVDRLFCSNGVKLVLDSDLAYQLNGKEWRKGEELGRDCSGIRRTKYTGLKQESAPGFVAMLSGTGGGKWPKVSKEATWGVSGAFLDNWGRSEKVRKEEIEKLEEYGGLQYTWRLCKAEANGWKHKCGKDPTAQTAWWDKHYKIYELKARATWLAANPGWLDEERRRLEVDASSQVAGEIAEMGRDNKAVVAGHLAKSIEGGEVVEIRSVSSTSVMVNAPW